MTRSKSDQRSAQFELIGKICDYMNTRGFFVWHQANHGRFDAEYALGRLVDLVVKLRAIPNYPNDKVEDAIKAILAKSWRREPHTIKGVGDIIGLHRSGTFVTVEVKIGSDRLSDDQTQWLARVRDFKGRAVVVSTFQEFKALFERKHGSTVADVSTPSAASG